MNNRFANWASLVAGALALAYLAWPYAALYRFHAALIGADRVTLLEQVDWPSLKRGFRDDLESHVRAEAATALDLAGGPGARVSLEWAALPLADQIAGVLATPRGLIALYDNSKAIRCVLAGIEAGDERPPPADCFRQEPLPENGTRPFELRGPNLGRWFEKIGYAFFTDPFAFRLDVLHEGIPVSLTLERRGLGWTVTRLSIPFRQITG